MQLKIEMAAYIRQWDIYSKDENTIGRSARVARAAGVVQLD
jgi:hypothetical protein